MKVGSLVKRFLLTLAIALGAGFLFSLTGLFLPWLLGPMAAFLILRQVTELEFHWPKVFRTLGLLLLGIQIGASFTQASVLLMVADLPYMFIMTIAVVVFSLLLGLLFQRMTRVNLSTALLGSMPGGLSQMVLIAEEVKSANVTVVSVMQTFRILLIVFTVPIAAGFLSGRAAGELVEMSFRFSPYALGIALVFGFALYWLMKRISFPARELMAPVLAMAVVQTVTGSDLIDLPALVIIIAQVLIGTHLGLSMEKLGDSLNSRLAGAVFLNTVLLIVFSAGLAYGLERLLPDYLFLDFFLSAAPGGMAEMTITALEAGADVPLVTSFHLFRLFFILLVAAPLVSYYVKKLDAKSGY
ncbi:AbrB family transcriptional regulator [Planococcus sp. ISL-109]|uniref:AbrB family transcriptional regulator n=1 Tax=Planococcus sp. ISL-109 TaxID=2819166 RepID=UPI00333C423B